MTERRPRVPYWQPPEHPEADERKYLVMTFAWEIRNSSGETPESLARRLLTRLDLRGWGPGQRAPADLAARARARRRVCPERGDQLPCRGCRADAKAGNSGDG